MAATSRFVDQKYVNWICGAIAMQKMKEGIEDFIDDQARQFQGDIFTSLGPSFKVCSRCTASDIKRDSWMMPWKMKCSFCDKILQKILLSNRCGKFPPLCKKNVQPSKWSTDPWEVMKLFLPRDYALSCCAKDIDCQGILKVFKNSDHFWKLMFNTAVVDELLTIRNTLFHSGGFSVTEKELNNYLATMTTFLQNLDGMSAEQEKRKDDAIKSITELNKNVGGSLIQSLESTALQFWKNEMTVEIETMKSELEDYKARLNKLEEEKGNNDVEIIQVKAKIEGMEENYEKRFKIFEKFVGLQENDGRKFQEITEQMKQMRLEQAYILDTLVPFVKAFKEMFNLKPTDTIKYFELKIQVSGQDEKGKEEQILKILRSEKVGLNHAQDNILAQSIGKLINIATNEGVDHVDSIKGSILLHFRCRNLQGFLEFLEMLRDKTYQNTLDEIENALHTLFKSKSRVVIQLTDESLRNICHWLAELCRQIADNSSVIYARDTVNWKTVRIQYQSLDDVASVASLLRYYGTQDGAAAVDFNVEDFIASIFNAYQFEEGTTKSSQAGASETNGGQTLKVDSAYLLENRKESKFVPNEENSDKINEKTLVTSERSVRVVDQGYETSVKVDEHLTDEQKGVQSKVQPKWMVNPSIKLTSEMERKMTACEETLGSDQIMNNMIDRINRFTIVMEDTLPGLSSNSDWFDQFIEELVEILVKLQILCKPRSDDENKVINSEWRNLTDLYDILLGRSMWLIRDYRDARTTYPLRKLGEFEESKKQGYMALLVRVNGSEESKDKRVHLIETESRTEEEVQLQKMLLQKSTLKQHFQFHARKIGIQIRKLFLEQRPDLSQLATDVWWYRFTTAIIVRLESIQALRYVGNSECSSLEDMQEMDKTIADLTADLLEKALELQNEYRMYPSELGMEKSKRLRTETQASSRVKKASLSRPLELETGGKKKNTKSNVRSKGATAETPSGKVSCNIL